LTATSEADGAAESVADPDGDGEIDAPAWSTWLDCGVVLDPATWLDPAFPRPLQPTAATPTSSAVAASLVMRLT
jgi:hypothetical protein